MPEASKELRDQFMINGSDGIHEAEMVIINAGGVIRKGVIRVDADMNAEVIQAIFFLCDEWDYCEAEEMVGKTYMHTKSKTVYKVLHEGNLQVDQKWFPAVVYSSVEDAENKEIFIRTWLSFQDSFKPYEK